MNHGIVTDSDSPFVPWSVGQSCTDALIDIATARGAEFSVDFGDGPLGRARIGGRHCSYLDPGTLKIVRWPSIGCDDARAVGAAVLHKHADQDTSVGVCYFIGGAEGAIKIGFSVDVASRLRTLRASSPIPLGVLATAPGGATRETAYHYQFAEHRLHGEWFARCPEIEAEIARLEDSCRRAAA